ncbi:hypothetical protein QFC22_003849 [Naganishia vaughanmartiniae]|uniref:Uncharacterized protein n=1 Tax=Naganishia vaughanmartiniae TaxID=1424756 RepID=A0ACC2X3M1_9TREE|nr:hypothetical protein QFC22_003849 [Naganishia vaughanmartiniae]
MAFIGSDGLEHQIKQLKAVIAQKDSQLTTILNEQHKKGELLDENKRARDDALYRVQSEADRADKAEKALALKCTELSNTLMKLANAESTVNANNERIKKDEKEIERLQYGQQGITIVLRLYADFLLDPPTELDLRLNNSSTSQSRIQEAHAALQVKIKSLEAQLQRVEAEKESLKVDASFADRNAAFRGHVAGGEREKDTVSSLERLVADLRKENIKLIEENKKNASTPNSSSTPTAPIALRSPQVSKRRRRSLSFNGDSRIQQLQDEVEDLKDQLSRGADYAEVDRLKETLANVKKKALKLENEKMALERSTNKAIEQMQSQLESTNEELEYLRRNDGGEAVEELEKLKKSAKREKEMLDSRIASLKEELSSKTDSMARVEKRLEVMEDELHSVQAALTAAYQAEKESDKEIRSLREQSAGRDEGAVQEKLNLACRQISKLEIELSTAQDHLSNMSEDLKRAQTAALAHQHTGSAFDASSSVAHFEKTIRKLQREVSALSRERDALQANLQENDDLLAEKDEQIFALQTRIPVPPSPGVAMKDDDSAVQLAAMSASLKDREEQLAAIRTQKAELEEQLRLQNHQVDELNGSISALLVELEIAKAAFVDAETVQQSLCRVEQELQSTQEELTRKKAQLVSLTQEVDILRAATQAAGDSRDEKRVFENTIQELRDRLNTLAEVEVDLKAAQAMLSDRSYPDAEVESIKQEVQRLENDTSRLQTKVEALEAEEFVTRRGKEAALEHISQLEGNIKAFEEQLAHDEEVYDKIISELREEKANVDVELAKASTEQESLKVQLQDLHDTLANRSSATESGERDMALLQAEAREAEMQTRISNLRDEYSSIETMSSIKIAEAEERESRLSNELQALHSEHALSVDNARALQSTIEILQSQIQESNEASQTHAHVRERLVEVEAMLQTTSQTEKRHSVNTEYNTAVIRELRREMNEVKRMLGFAEIEYEVLLEASQEDQHTYHTVVNELQQRLSTSASEAEQLLESVKIDNENARDALQREVITLRDNLSAVELSLQENNDSLKVSEDRIGHLRVLLHEREKEVTLLRTSMAEIGQPVDGTALQLREEIAQLEARIERRNRQIALEQEKARKLAMNLQLAQETLEEQDSAIQTVKEQLADCEKKRLVCEGQITSLNNQNAELVDKVQRITKVAACQQEKFSLIVAEQQDELLRSDTTQYHLILQILIHRSIGAQASLTSHASAKKLDRLLFDVSAARGRVQQTMSMLRKTVEQQEKDRRESEVALETLRLERQTLATELDRSRLNLEVIIQEKAQIEASSKKFVAKLSNEVDAHRREAALAQTEIANTRNETSTLQELLDLVEAEKTALSQAVDEAQERILHLEQSLADTNNRLNENQSALETDRVHRDRESRFTKDIDSVRAECVALQQTVDSLRQELNDAKKGYENSLQASKEAEAVLILAKQGAEEEMARRASERDSLRVERDVLTAQIAEIQQALERQQDETKNREEQLQEAINDMRQKYETTAELLAAASDQVSQLEASLGVAERRCLQLSCEVDRAQEQLAVTQQEVETNQRHLVAVEQERSEQAARIGVLEETVAALRQSETRLVVETEAARVDVAAKSASLAELQEALQARQRDIESLHKSHADGSRDLQAALAAATRELEFLQEERRAQSRQLEATVQELREAKSTLVKKTEELQNLGAQGHATEEMLNQIRQTVVALTGERDRLVVQISEFASERKDFNARLESMNNEMEEHMENLREAQKAKTSAQRKLEKLERKLKALGETSAATVDKSKTISSVADTTLPVEKLPPRQVTHEAGFPTAAPSSGRKRAREPEQQSSTTTPALAAVFAPSPFERTARSPIKHLPGGRAAFTPNRTPNRPMAFVPTDENLGSKPSAFTPKMRILSEPSPFTKATTTPGSTFADEKLATLRTKLADMRTQNM